MLGGLFEQNVLLFTIPAMLGTAVFLLKLGLMAFAGIGGDFDADAPDLDIDLDADVDLGADVEGGDSTEAFTLLSLQSIAVFLMGFGWGGVAGRLGLGWDLTPSLALGAGFGAAMVWLLGMLMKAVYDLRSSGNIRIADAAGAQGTVYTNVPARGEGRGQVRVVINDRARIYNAVAVGEAIKTSTAVRVVQVNEDQTLTVTSV